MQTAEIISKELKINPKNINIDDRINEIDYGIISGSTKGDKIDNEYMKEFNKLPKDPIKLVLAFEMFDKTIQKKFKVESAIKVKKRIQSFYSSLPSDSVSKHIIVVTHGGIVNGTINALFNINPPVKGDTSNGKNCTINCITKTSKTSKKLYQLITLPNTLHLK